MQWRERCVMCSASIGAMAGCGARDVELCKGRMAWRAVCGASVQCGLRAPQKMRNQENFARFLRRIAGRREQKHKKTVILSNKQRQRRGAVCVPCRTAQLRTVTQGSLLWSGHVDLPLPQLQSHL